MQPVSLALIAVGIVLALLGVVVLLLIIRKKYSLNWYQKTSLEDSKLVNSGGLRVVRQHVTSRKLSSLSTSSDEELGEDNSALLNDDSDDDLYKQRHGLFEKLSKHVGFIQPPTSDPKTQHCKMGAEESRQIKPILKTQKSDLGPMSGSRRFSAPVVYGKGNAEMSHNKLAGTRSAPFSTPLNPANEESFTLPITSSDESHSASAIARLARRRTSMQDSIDMTGLDPALYKIPERAPPIKEEASVDINEPIGILYLTVLLSKDTNLLKVTIHKADLTGFPNSHLQLKSPYFTLLVSGSESPVRQTRHADEEQLPVFEESFLFETEDDLSGKHLLCHLYDYDQFVKTEKVGVVQLRLNSLPHDESLYVEKHIDRCLPESHDHEENYVGELLFSVKSTKAKDNLTLTFFFAKAKDLHIEDEIAVLGLTVRVTVLEDGKKLKKKRTIDNIKVTTNPLFNQEIVLVLPQHVNLADMSIVVDLCKVKISSYEVVGRVYISADGDKRGAEHWRELQHSLNTNNKSLEWWHQLKKVAKGS